MTGLCVEPITPVTGEKTERYDRTMHLPKSPFIYRIELRKMATITKEDLLAV